MSVDYAKKADLYAEKAKLISSAKSWEKLILIAKRDLKRYESALNRIQDKIHEINKTLSNYEHATGDVG